MFVCNLEEYVMALMPEFTVLRDDQGVIGIIENEIRVLLTSHA